MAIVIGEGAARGAARIGAARTTAEARGSTRMTDSGLGLQPGQNRQPRTDEPDASAAARPRLLRRHEEARWQPADITSSTPGSSSKIYDRLEAQALARCSADAARGACALDQVDARATRRRFVDAAGRRDMSGLRRGTIFSPDDSTHDHLRSGLRAAEGRHRTGHDPSPKHALVHSIGLGGFYYSSARSNVSRPRSAMQTGMAKVKWSAAGHASSSGERVRAAADAVVERGGIEP